MRKNYSLILFMMVLGWLLVPQALAAVNDSSSEATNNKARLVAGSVRYVNDDVPGGNNDGTSWENAYATLQDALAAANSEDEIWVAAGVYYPDEGAGQTDNDQTATFQLLEGVEIYGGFAATETLRTERNWETNITVLSGDIDQNDTTDAHGVVLNTVHISGDNAYSVVTGSATDSSAVLDGFTITAGDASFWVFSGRVASDSGAGMFNDNGSPTVANATFIGNSVVDSGAGIYNHSSSPTFSNVYISHNFASDNGGGMFNDNASSATLISVTLSANSASDDGGGMYNDSSDPTLTNVILSANSASSGGGGIYNDSSDPTLTNVILSRNTASSGGGMFSELSEPTLTNVTLSRNSAIYYGGGMYNLSDSNPTLTNVTLSRNSASYEGGGILNVDNSDPLIQNSILWANQDSSGADTAEAQILNYYSSDNPTVRYSIVQGGLSNGTIDGGDNLLNQDPLFVAPISGDLRLLAGSPAIDVGDNNADLNGSQPGPTTISDIPTDLAGNARIQNGTVDLGPYEGAASVVCPAGTHLHVKDDASGDENGSDWLNAFTKLQDAFLASDVCDINEIWVAAGTYYPDEGAGQTDNYQASTFQLLEGIEIYGGFAATETLRTQRNWQTNITVLSGDIDQNDTTDANGVITNTNDINGHNVYSVVTGSGTDSAVVDGFTITAGHASQSVGGQVASDSGAGMFNDSGSPTVANATFIGNSAVDSGGGIFNYNSSHITLINVILSHNFASDDGGGMYNDSSHPTLTNVTLSRNVALYGAGIYNFNNSDPLIQNSILWGNENLFGTSTAPVQIVNISSSPTVRYSIVQDGLSNGTIDGGNNLLDQDPLFVNATGGDLRVFTGSPALDAGDNNADLDAGGAGTTTISEIPTDLAGNPRIQDGTVDLGAYEGAVSVACPAGTRLHVKDDATGDENGSDWPNAFTKLQDSFFFSKICENINEIWVAAGVYYPDEGSRETDNNRDSTFQLLNGLAIYGGFAGTETERSLRNWQTNITVLSGDIDQNDTTDANGVVIDTENISGNNAYSVVTGSATDSSAVLDGFTITAGHTNLSFSGSEPSKSGAGMFNDNGSPTVANATFIGNWALRAGAGIYNHSSSPTFSNLYISHNSTSSGVGGGMFNDNSSSPTLTNVTLSANSASLGGGMYNFFSNPTLTNVTVSANFASYDGGGIYNYSSNPTLTNVTVSRNSASDDGGGMRNNDNSDPLIQNSILWENEDSSGANTAQAQIANSSSSDDTPTVAYSIVQDGLSSGTIDGGNNLLNQDPLFVAPTSDDLRLLVGSPAIDAGDNNADLDAGGAGTTTISDILTDLAGNPRFADVPIVADTGNGSAPFVDMGAYEVGPPDVQCTLSEGMTYDFNQTTVVPIQIDTQGDLDCIAVYRSDENYPLAPAGIQTGRYWFVDVVNSSAAQASGFSLTVTLPHSLANPSDARICRLSDGEWDCDNTHTTATADTVTRSQMSEFSPIAVGNAEQPLAVNLASFTADVEQQSVRLQWQTVSELNNLGFNLYRATAPNETGEQINSELIPSQAPGSGQGAAYEFVDETVEAGKRYYYWLEDVNVDGVGTQHGPVSAEVNTPSALTIGDLRTTNSSSLLWTILPMGLLLLASGWRWRAR